MDSGIAYFPTHDGLDPVAIARLVEERGHRWLMFPEHSHIPASRESPWPAGGELPRKYSHTYDLFVALTAAAMATSRLRVGSGICLVVERDPIFTAKEVASIDHLSGGRFEFGVGAGWNREEMANHGTDPRRRMAIMAERVKAMQEIWTQEEASFHGEHVDFERIWSWPKPAQHPHPPILVGGNGPTVLDRVLDFGDAWMPNHSRRVTEQMAELERRADEAGRTIPVIVMSVPPKPKLLEIYEQAGAERVMFWLPSTRLAGVERALDEIEDAMTELHGD
jgi:probable F420-dependent oxidoreductase